MAGVIRPELMTKAANPDEQVCISNTDTTTKLSCSLSIIIDPSLHYSAIRPCAIGLCALLTSWPRATLFLRRLALLYSSAPLTVAGQAPAVTAFPVTAVCALRPVSFTET